MQAGEVGVFSLGWFAGHIGFVVKSGYLCSKIRKSRSILNQKTYGPIKTSARGGLFQIQEASGPWPTVCQMERLFGSYLLTADY